ncbi:hypothetical protein NQ176_g5391 [Zarea fungicola]|uniref:Uncharacterized protein n=1 Tax=Zarea fungicola TaxID=93591 RepID=A0ACC1N8R8_9HYPO|nr:hypothetical protein NQ176_g5391 [Lecanicillium fungicola]
MSSEDEPQSIKDLYAEAEASRAALEYHRDPRSESFTTSLATTLAIYTRCRDQIAAVSLFSPNESLEDVATSSLPYMLLDLRLAEVVQRTPYVDPPQRKLLVRRARAAYDSFLSLVDSYSLVTGRYAKLLKRYREDPEKFAVKKN